MKMVSLMISETREYLLVIHLKIFFFKFGFVSDCVCDFAIIFMINVINIKFFQILGFLA